MNAELKQAKLATKNDIADFMKKTDFDEKLKKKSIKMLLQTKKQHIEAEKALNHLLEEVKLISPKELTKDLKNE